MKNYWNKALFAGVLMLAGCNNEATGQVAAVVNDEEITLQEVNAELEAMGPIPEGADEKALQQAALQRVVERRLLAQSAREEGLDKTPDFLIRSRQLEDALLVQLLGRNAARGSDVPDQKKVDEYIRANPALFADRTIYTLDRIQFPMPSDPNQLKALEDDHSMEAVEAQLRSLGIRFTRERAGMDSAQLGQERLKQIRALPAGEPFMVPEGGMVTVAVITGETKQPNAGDQARPLAAQAIRNQALMDSLQQRLKAAKAEAEIEYQSGFAPPASRDTNGKGAPSR